MKPRFGRTGGMVAACLALALAASCSAKSTPPSGGSGGKAVVGIDTIDHMDPQLWYGQSSWAVADLVCTPMLKYADAGGDAGKVLVPGITELPKASDGGRTWTFTVRSGVKFSNGQPITAADLKYTLERALAKSMTPVATGFWGYLTGEKGLEDGTATTADGIVASGDTLTLHLTQPYGSIPALAAMKWLCPVPVGTPRTPIEDGSLEQKYASGPYMVKSYTEGRNVVLVRNPNYSADVLGKRGNFDEFDMPIGVSSQQALEEIQAGQMDTTVFALSAAEVATANVDPRMDGRVFAFPMADTRYTFLNNDVAPFNNVKVRQAVNFAVDRNQMVKILGGTSIAQPTDQILPPTMAGWKRIAAYPNSPDLDKAKALMAQSGVSTPITVDCYVQPTDEQTAQVMQSDLAKIGINLNLKNGPNTTLSPIVTKRSSHAPMEIGANWGQDYPNGDDFFTPLLDPRNVDTSPALARFGATETIPDFVAAQTELDPVKQAALYQALDEKITTNYAPWVAMYNPVSVQVISTRVTNYVYDPTYNWVKLSLLKPASS